MAVRVNWARMRVTGGGTGTLQLEAITGSPTFSEDPSVGSGVTTNLRYSAKATGFRETGVCSYDGTLLRISSRTVTEAWRQGVGYSESALDLPVGTIITSGSDAEEMDTFEAGIATIATHSQPISRVTGLQAELDDLQTQIDTLESSGVADGDKGGITVSGGVWTVDDNTITPAKLVASANMRKVIGETATDEERLDALALGTAALLDEGQVALDGHTHTLASLEDVDLTGATEDQLLAVNALGQVVPITASLDSFASAGITGSDTDIFAIFDPEVGEEGAWVPATRDEVLAKLGNATVCPLPGDITADGTYSVCLFSPVAGTITAVCMKTLGGSATFNFKIGTTSITGISAVAATTTKATTNATATNVLARGDEINVTVTSAVSLTGITGVLLVERLAPAA